MCVIVDANVAAQFFNPKDEDYRPVRDWIDKNDDVCIVFGGKNLVELGMVELARIRILRLSQRGKARLVDATKVQSEETRLARLRPTSDDPHVLALARVSGARLLCTSDQALIDDFKNHEFLSKPRGKIYRKPKHSHLLVHVPGCPGWNPERPEGTPP